MNGQDKLQLFSCLPKRQERERFFHGCNMFVTAAVHMLDLSPIWQTPAIGARCSDFERPEIAGCLVSPESIEARRPFKAPREDDSSLRMDLEQSTPNERRL